MLKSIRLNVSPDDVPRARRATIQDVAAAAGVSTATVSKHINGGVVRQAAAIDRAIQEARFQPSVLARNLRRGLSEVIGVVVPDITNPFFAAVVKGIEAVTRDDAVSVLLGNTDERVDLQGRLIETLLQHRVSGLLIAPATEVPEDVAELGEADIPIVFIDRFLPGMGNDSVLVDNAGGAALAARHLMGLGHERIAMISGPLNTTPGRERHEGFLEAIATTGNDIDDRYIVVSDFRETGGYQAALKLMGVHPAPTAMFVANNLMTIGALRAIHDLGIRMPEEISFVGFDDLEVAELLDPPLTVIRRPTSEQGVLAMRLLVKRVRGEESGPPLVIRMETEIVVRGSTGPAAAVTSPRRPRRSGTRSEEVG
jgi:LacI family transcriptional regulator